MKTVVVTGATSGIGFAVCRKLAASNYSIIGVGRSEENCKKALELLKQEYPDVHIAFFSGDLSRQIEVLRVSNEIKKYIEAKCNGQLYGLISNAGCVRSYYMTTEDGLEQQFAVNHLAGFLLIYYLLQYLFLQARDQSHMPKFRDWQICHLNYMQKAYSPVLIAYKPKAGCIHA